MAAHVWMSDFAPLVQGSEQARDRLPVGRPLRRQSAAIVNNPIAKELIEAPSL